ncbi:uncharacterized protein [Ciconia boyciana]|uniref:uncharacterized protein n=1 Tax=Ciconia boyciana TaxID=52775 RepID=UPI003BA38D5C
MAPRGPPRPIGSGPPPPAPIGFPAAGSRARSAPPRSSGPAAAARPERGGLGAPRVFPRRPPQGAGGSAAPGGVAGPPQERGGLIRRGQNRAAPGRAGSRARHGDGRRAAGPAAPGPPAPLSAEGTARLSPHRGPSRPIGPRQGTKRPSQPAPGPVPGQLRDLPLPEAASSRAPDGVSGPTEAARGEGAAAGTGPPATEGLLAASSHPVREGLAGVGAPSSPLALPRASVPSRLWRLEVPALCRGKPSLAGKAPSAPGAPRERRLEPAGLEPAGLSASCPSRDSPPRWEAMAVAALAVGSS